MRGLLAVACLMMAGLLFSPAPAEAAGRWVKSCNGRSCQMVWVEDRPAAKVFVAPQAHAEVRGCPDTCYGPNGCTCIANGGQCNCHELKAAGRSKQVAVPKSSRRSWWFGKNLGRPAPN